MKKKILQGIIALLTFLGLVNGINAATRTAKIPSAIPDENDALYAVVDDEFDFRLIKFSSANGGDDINGKTGMRKIVLTANPVNTATTLNEAIGDSWFTAYCLDGNAQFPEYNLFNFDLKSLSAAQKVWYAILFTLYNNKDYYNVFEPVKGYTFLVDSETKLPAEFTIDGGLEPDNVVTKLGNGETVKVKIKKIHYVNLNNADDKKDITAKDFDSAADNEVGFEVTLDTKNLLFNNYSAKGTTQYDHALWIIEHSYPTLTLEETYAAAGTNVTNVLAELAMLLEVYSKGGNYEQAKAAMDADAIDALGNPTTALSVNQSSLNYIYQCATKTLEFPEDFVYPKIAEGLNEKIDTFGADLGTDSDISDELRQKMGAMLYGKESLSADDISPEVCGAVIQYYKEKTHLEDFTYSTIQYAVWKANGSTISNGKLGDTLKGSTELNKLYQYLIKNRDEYNGYSTLEFSNTITLNKPASGKEIATESKEAYTYGPYSISHTFISLDGAKLSIDGKTKGASIVDKNGNAISEIKANEKFYVKCNKSEKIANIKVKVSAVGAKTFYPGSNRGRVYYASSPILQNVVSGGKLVEHNVEQSFELIYNPKTGVQNIAIIFVISLIAFSLGYLALNYKNKSVSLD